MKRVFFSLILMLFCLSPLFGNPATAYGQTKRIEKQVIVHKDGLRLGVILSTIPEKEKGHSGIEHGAYVLSVLKDSPAEKAGLKKGDIILKMDGTTIETPADVVNVLSQTEDEETISVTIQRGERKLTVTVVPESFSREEMVWIPEPESFSLRMKKFLPLFKEQIQTLRTVSKGGYLGVHVDELTDQLKEYFGVQNGVLIKEVIEDSPAEKAGLKAGDIIMEISGKKIEDYQDLIRVINYYDPGDKLKIKIMRKGKKKTIEVKLGKKPFAGWFGKNYFQSLEKLEKLFNHDFLKELEAEIEMCRDHYPKTEEDTILLIL
jgi:C-terminal processing protease CtpA/Prc